MEFMIRYIKHFGEKFGTGRLKILTYMLIKLIFLRFDQLLVITCLIDDIN
jgi:hypothetical protein